MKATLKLFKAVPVTLSRETVPQDLIKRIMEQTIPDGFIFGEEVLIRYKDSLKDLIGLTKNIIGLSAEQMNSAFHKSWAKIRNSPLEQLVLEQLIHYLTTYGFEAAGFFLHETVYIPKEAFDLPHLKEPLHLIVIHGLTNTEIQAKTMQILTSGIALQDDTVNDLLEVLQYLGNINEETIAKIKNKEVRVKCYDFLDMIPANPTEFLRFLVYKATGKTLLIKNKETITKIKASNIQITAYLNKYPDFEKKLATIFYRFKPLFLAFRKDINSKHRINSIRKLAPVYHQPMPEDFLNHVTAKLTRNEEPLNLEQLQNELAKVNPFRKIRLAYALKYRTNNPSSILYKIRNGKGYATEFTFPKYTNFPNVPETSIVLDTVLKSIASNISKNVKGKTIYIPDNVFYALPSSEKQFVGNVPAGSYISVPQDMILGIHWDNLDHHRIDLDLAASNLTEKIGWDGAYRNTSRTVLSSGDMTDAPKPNGASECFYVQRGLIGFYLFTVNYFNYHDIDQEIPFSFFVAHEPVTNLCENYLVNPNNIRFKTTLKAGEHKHIVGLLHAAPTENTFYFTGIDMEKGRTARNTKAAQHTFRALVTALTHPISLNDLLIRAGALITTEKQGAAIDLSPEAIDKTTILNFFKKSK